MKKETPWHEFNKVLVAAFGWTLGYAPQIEAKLEFGGLTDVVWWYEPPMTFNIPILLIEIEHRATTEQIVINALKNILNKPPGYLFIHILPQDPDPGTYQILRGLQSRFDNYYTSVLSSELLKSPITWEEVRQPTLLEDQIVLKSGSLQPIDFGKVIVDGFENKLFPSTRGSLFTFMVHMNVNKPIVVLKKIWQKPDDWSRLIYALRRRDIDGPRIMSQYGLTRSLEEPIKQL